MVITEDVPGAYPVSDWSASSSSAEGAEEFVRSSRPLHARFNSDATASSIPGVVLETSLCCQETEPSSPLPHDRPQKHVSFGNLEVRKYPVILGDNPECSQGPPISIGWDHFKTSVVPVSVYEEERPPRRNREELKLGWIERKQILRKCCGSSDEEMREAICEAHEIQRQRRQSSKRLSFGEYGQFFFKKLKNIRKSSPPKQRP